MLSSRLAAHRAWLSAPNQSIQRRTFRLARPLFLRSRPLMKRAFTFRQGSSNDARPVKPVSSDSLIFLTIGAATIVFAGMRYAVDPSAERVYIDVQSFCRQNLGDSIAAVVTPNIDRMWLTEKLETNFILSAEDPAHGRYFPILGCAFAHVQPLHFMFNMFTFASVGQSLVNLPKSTLGALIIGSALSSSCAWLYTQRGDHQRSRAGLLGSSGIVSGVFAAAALWHPMATVSIMGVVPVPFIAAAVGYIALDTYFMSSGANTGVAHAAHLGGTAYGAAFYVLFLRRCPGILRFLKR